MREIKFRAWHPNCGMVIFDRMEFCAEYNCLTFVSPKFADISYGALPYEFYDEEKTIVMQYTGLKDKNGKDIYEGDIVQDVSPRFIQNYTVSLNNECSIANCLYCFYDDGPDSISHKLEVIGNIYENKDIESNSIKERDDWAI